MISKLLFVSRKCLLIGKDTISNRNHEWVRQGLFHTWLDNFVKWICFDDAML